MILNDVPSGQLVGFTASDGVALSGILFSPVRRGRDAVVYLHGNGDSSVFRSSRTNLLARQLVKRGIAFFPFDNRGSGLLRWLKRRNGDETEYLTGGMTHELIRDCELDIEGALRFVRGLGYRRVHLAGHSSGANKIVLYHSRQPRNTVSSYALLAPGDDTGIYYRALGPKRFQQAIARSKEEIDKGHGDRRAPSSWSPFPITYQSLYDTMNPDGDYNIFPFLEELEGIRLSRKALFGEFATIGKRMMVAYGSEDEFCNGDPERCVEVLRSYSLAPQRLKTFIFDGADHGFHGRMEELGAALASHVAEK